MKAIILAAGKGTRLQGDGKLLPKVLRRANGRPLLSYVLDTLDFIKPSDITVVTGFMHEKVIEEFQDFGCNFVLQGDKAYGTGYAVMCALESAEFDNYDGDVVVLYGDSPLIKKSTIYEMCSQHKDEGNKCTLLSCVTDQKLPYGRIVRDDKGIIDIKEEKECTEEEKKIKELNVGAYIFDFKSLKNSISLISNDNAAREYYFTSVPPIMIKSNEKVNSYITYDDDELCGVNTPEDLINVENILKRRAI